MCLLFILLTESIQFTIVIIAIPNTASTTMYTIFIISVFTPVFFLKKRLMIENMIAMDVGINSYIAKIMKNAAPSATLLTVLSSGTQFTISINTVIAK